jgi:hypothetical protein
VRRDLTWAAPSVPEIRRQWCNALDATAERNSASLLEPASGAAAKRIQRLQEKTAAAIEVMKVRSGRVAQRRDVLGCTQHG